MTNDVFFMRKDSTTPWFKKAFTFFSVAVLFNLFLFCAQVQAATYSPNFKEYRNRNEFVYIVGKNLTEKYGC